MNGPPGGSGAPATGGITGMNIPDAVMDKAYATFEEWGPKRQIPRRQRLMAKFPTLSPEQIEWLMTRMEAVSATVWRIAEAGGEAKLGSARVSERLREEHPFLRAAGLRQALFLVSYYAWHEGYDK